MPEAVSEGMGLSRYRLPVLGILLVFSIGLVGFYAFSAPYGDGLEVTMEEAGVEEGEPLFTAPLEYGEDYIASLLMGVLGFALTAGIMYGLVWVMRGEDAS